MELSDPVVGQPRTLSPEEGACDCVNDHRPIPQELHVHHRLPLAWGGADEADNELVLCPTTHSNLHRLLRAYVKAGGLPSWELRRRYGWYTRREAAHAWRLRLNAR